MAATSSLLRKPVRMTITDLNTLEERTAQFNPTELGEVVGAAWNDVALLGMGYKPSQFNQSENYKPEIELAFRAFDDDGNKVQNLLDTRKFLMSLCYPTRGGQGVAGTAPPRALFFWPNLISITCTVRRVEFRHTLFDINAIPLHSSAKIEMSEIRDVNLYSQDVRSMGTIRTPGGGLL